MQHAKQQQGLAEQVFKCPKKRGIKVFKDQSPAHTEKKVYVVYIKNLSPSQTVHRM